MNLAIIAVLLLIGGTGIMFILAPYIIATTGAATGVCIFKGPSSYGGLFGSSSDGIPLRYINVSIWRTYPPYQEPGPTYFTQGLTDRMGCFTYQHATKDDFADYFYNGVEYTDQMTPVVIRRDNLPCQQ